MMTLSLYLKMLRTKQWLKNLLVFLPIMMFPEYISVKSVHSLFITFTLFSVSASMDYIVNDRTDRYADALHDEKNSVHLRLEN